MEPTVIFVSSVYPFGIIIPLFHFLYPFFFVLFVKSDIFLF